MGVILRAAWPILAVIQVLGWFPARRSNDILYPCTRFKIYSALVLSLQLVPGVYFVIKGLSFVPSLDPKLHLVSYVQLICAMLLPQCISFFAFIYSSNHINFWNKIQFLELAMNKLSLSQRPMKVKTVRRVSLITVISMNLPMIKIMIIFPIVFQTTRKWNLDFYMPLGFANMILIMGWTICVTYAIKLLSHQLIDNFKVLCEYNESGKTGMLVGKVALEMRPLWLQLCRLVQDSGDALAMSVAVHMLNCFTFLIYVIYQVIGDQYLSMLLFYSFFVVSGLSMIYVICACAESVSVKVSNDIMEAIKIVKETKTSIIVQNQMLKFLVFLLQSSPKISLNGYVTLEKKLVSSLVYAIITNMLVLYQLKINERRLELREIFSFGDGNIL